MPAFNLIDDPWIPVRWLDANRSEPLVGLRRLFTEADGIADLSANPAERVSLMRLLICITQAAIGAPPHPEAWDGFGDDLLTEAPNYLARPEIHGCFELFGNGPRFLQVESFESQIEPPPLAKLVFHCATGNSSTLFDHEGESPRSYHPAFIARTLLTFQNFLIGGSFGAFVKGNGPSLKMLHSFLIGRSIKETILMNCLDEETLRPTAFGRPSWEQPLDKSDETTSGSTYLGRLVPSSAKLWLIGDGANIKVGQGLQYPDFTSSEFREPSSTVCVSKKEKGKRYLLRADVERGIWRDLHAVVVPGKEAPSGPLTLTSHRADFDDDRIQIWTGELIKAEDAKIVDSTESVFTIPRRLLDHEGRVLYETGVTFALGQELTLQNGIDSYFRTLDGRNQNRLAKASGPASAGKRAGKKHYWHILDREAQVLLDLISDPEAMNGREFGKWVDGMFDPWTAIVRSALRTAYDATCPRQTPRQFEAYAAGLRVLFPKPSKPKKSSASNPVASVR